MRSYFPLGLLAAGFALAAWLDPRLFGAAKPPPQWIAATNAETVFIGLALLQFLLMNLNREAPLSDYSLRVTTAGVVFYGVGAAGILILPSAGWLTLAGSALSLSGYLALMRHSHDRRLLFALIAAGMALDILIDLSFLHFPGLGIGPPDGFPLRLLRLARVACFALPILCFLAEHLARDGGSRATRWMKNALLFGAVGLPLSLALAALVHPALKYLLPVPAEVVFGGVIIAAWLSARRTGRLESVGWVLIALSMAVGLLMGGYSFNGPLPAPPGLEGYGDPGRRLIRLAHTDTILLGISVVFMARRLGALGRRRSLTAAALTAAGAAIMIGLLLIRLRCSFPSQLLAIGPSLIVVALLLIEYEDARKYPH